MLDALAPLIAARLLAVTAAALPGGWTLRPGTTIAADGTLSSRVCCKGELHATRLVFLPRGGTITIEGSAPCATSLYAWVEGEPLARAMATPMATAAEPSGGVMTLTVPPGPPRRLTIHAEGGLRCCGAVEVRRVIATAAPPT